MPANRLIRHFKIDKDVAEALVEAGYNTPAKIRKASDKKLKAVRGIGQVTIQSVRKAIK